MRAPFFTFRPLAVPSRGSTELAIWALELAPGVHSETHSMDREEVFVVIEGKVSATVAGEDVRAEAGDAIVVARPRDPATAQRLPTQSRQAHGRDQRRHEGDRRRGHLRAAVGPVNRQEQP
ncbi:cupin domain-containing protein [Kitasatospora sp. NPDC001660]